MFSSKTYLKWNRIVKTNSFFYWTKFLSKNIFYLSAFEQMSDHNNDSSVLLPDHPPESCKGSLNRALSRDVGPRLPESVHKVCVQIFLLPVVQRVHVAAGDARTKSNSGVIVWKKFFLRCLLLFLSLSLLTLFCFFDN